MVPIKKLDEKLSVAPQIAEEDFAALAKEGFRTVINNRPENEGPDQIPDPQARQLADAAGLAYLQIPVTSQSLGPEAIARFGQALNEEQGPILAHCRSGTRSTLLWALSQAEAGTFSVEEIMERAAKAGYDLSAMRPMIEAHASGRG